MNFWLKFRSKTITRAFDDNSDPLETERPSKFLVSVLLAQVSFFILQIPQMIFAGTTDAFNYHLYTAIVVLLSSIISASVFLLNKRFSVLKSHPIQVIGIPTLMNLVAVYELYLAFGDIIVYQSSVDCGLIHFWAFLAAALISLPKIWYVKSLLVFACSTYILLRKVDTYSITLAICNTFLSLLLTLALTFGFYQVEKQDKEIFLSHSQTSIREDVLKSLLDSLPEGIMILDHTKTPFYHNKAMHVVLDSESDKEAILNKLEDLHINQIVEEIIKLGDTPLLLDYSGPPSQANFGPFSPLSAPKRTISESPEADSPGLEPIVKRKSRTGTATPENQRFSKVYLGKNSFLYSQEYNDLTKSKQNFSTISNPLKKNSDVSRVRLKEESIICQDLPANRSKPYRKKGSSGLYHLDANFRIEFNDEKFKGYASNPVVTEEQDCIMFNIYGQYYKNGRDLFLEQEPQLCAYEIKVLRMNLKGEEYKVVIISDISIREKLANLEENSKFKNLMFASLSHEFRTPLNGIYSTLETAVKQVKDTDVVKKYLNPALINSHLLLFLINDMLDYSTALSGKLVLSLKTFSLKECFKEIMDLMEPQVQIKNLTLDLKIAPGVPKRMCSDQRRIQQVLINLLSNATKFTSKGGIVVSLDLDPLSVHVIRVSVKDTGVGINEVDIEKLNRLMTQFDMTEKISNSSTGVGMGLMMSQALALALGPPEEPFGIQIDSENGKGSTFQFSVYNYDSAGTLEDIISIPTLPEERSPETYQTDFLTTLFSPKQGIKHIHTIGKKKSLKTNIPLIINIQCPCCKVLVVDDTPYNILALQTQLQSLGVASEIAFNGQEAVDKICLENKRRESCCRGYKLVFMDCNMPILDGYEATRKIRIKMERREIAPVTVIGYTAYTDKNLLDQGLQSGMEECLTKPMTIKDLKRVLETYGIIKKVE